MTIKHIPFGGDDYKPQLGLQPLDVKEWVEIDDQWERQLTRKQELLDRHPDVVLAALPGSEEGCLELRQALGDHLQARFPERYRFANGEMHLRSRRFERPRSGFDALEQVGRWTQEDWTLLSARPPARLEAGTVCFPSRWSLKDKIGQDSFGIHASVPRFEAIAKPTQGFLERITVEKPVWRLNWTIHDSDELFCPGAHPEAGDITRANVLDKTWLRVERQTLRRLPSSGMVVFSIRTYVHPVQEVIAEPRRRVLLKQALAALPHDTAKYKGMRAFRALLQEAL